MLLPYCGLCHVVLYDDVVMLNQLLLDWIEMFVLPRIMMMLYCILSAFMLIFYEICDKCSKSGVWQLLDAPRKINST